MRTITTTILLVVILAPAWCAADESAATEIAPRLSMTAAAPLPSGEVLHQRHPSVAYGDGVYLIVWQDGYNGVGGDSNILGLRLDKTGRALDRQPIAICTEKSIQDGPAVAYTGGRFLVTWADFRNGSDYDVYAAFVDPRGKVAKRDGFLLSGGKGGQANPAVAGNGKDTFLAAWQDFRNGERYQIYAARLSARSGEVLDAGGFEALVAGEMPTVTWTGKHFLVGQRWYAALIGEDGKPAATVAKTWNSKTVLWSTATSAWGKGFLFFNTEFSHDPWGWGGNGAIIGTSVGPDGKSPEWGWIPSLRALSGLEADGKVKNCLDAARWRNHAGWPMGMPGGFKGTHEGTWPSGKVAAAFNGRGIVVVWRRAHVVDKRRIRNGDLYLTRVLDGWAMVDRPKVKLIAGPTDEANPVLCGGPLGETLLAYEQVDPEGGVGVRYHLIREAEDRQGPGVAYLSRMSAEQMIVGFDEPVDRETASKAQNYVIAGGKVRSATFNEDGRGLQREVVLQTDPQTPGKTYGLSVRNVRDRSAARNVTTAAPVTYACKPAASERSDFVARWNVVGPLPSNWNVDHVDPATVRPSPGDQADMPAMDDVKAMLKQVIPAKEWADDGWDTQAEKHFVGERKWQAVESRGRCVLDISRLYGRLSWATMYANVYVYSHRRRNVLVRLDTNDGNRVWLNGTVISFDPTRGRTRGFHDYTNETRAVLERGWNQLLVQVENRLGSWMLAGQITDPAGQPIRDLTWQLENPFK